jgi:hypothetical protein
MAAKQATSGKIEARCDVLSNNTKICMQRCFTILHAAVKCACCGAASAALRAGEMMGCTPRGEATKRQASLVTMGLSSLCLQRKTR